MNVVQEPSMPSPPSSLSSGAGDPQGNTNTHERIVYQLVCLSNSHVFCVTVYILIANYYAAEQLSLPSFISPPVYLLSTKLSRFSCKVASTCDIQFSSDLGKFFPHFSSTQFISFQLLSPGPWVIQAQKRAPNSRCERIFSPLLTKSLLQARGEMMFSETKFLSLHLQNFKKENFFKWLLTIICSWVADLLLQQMKSHL